jgi:hypothetical protein
MSKLGCTCGHIIRDQTDSIPYKARFIRDQDDESFHAYAADIEHFIEAIKRGERIQWIKNHFSDAYPDDIPDSHIINDIIMKYEIKFENTLYQCQNCGRVKIQVQNTNHFTSFTPENDDCLGIFERIQE